ncbi:nitroreductase [soil metagenome]
MPAISNQGEVIELINHVRQARQYDDTAVSDEQIRELLEVARWTGSSRNTQPWHFIAITDKDKLQAISQLRTPINWVASAPLAIAIVLDGESDLSEAYDEGRVTERLMVAAHAMGLGGGIAWFGDEQQQAQAKQILGIPEDRTARSVVVIGHPTSVKDPRPNPAQAGRHPLSEIASLNTMGNSVG